MSEQESKELTDADVKKIAQDELLNDMREQNLMPLITIAGDEKDTMVTFTGLSPKHTVELLREALEEAKSRLKTMS